MARVTIRPQRTGASDMQMSINAPRPIETAIERFANAVGLDVTTQDRKTDADNKPFVEFRLGTGTHFVAFIRED